MQPLLHLFERVVSFCLFTLCIGLCSITNAQNCQSNNFAASKTVVTNDNSDVAGNLVDGNLLTDWFGPADSKWIYVDLGANQNLCKVTFKGSIWGSIPQTLVQVSNDASAWTTVYTFAAGAEGNHVHDPNNSNYDYDYFDVDLSATTAAYRYVRLYYPSGAQWGPHIKELEVYIKQPTVTPSITLIRPTSGNTYLQGSTINIAANASEQGGSISKVEFYANSTLLGQSLAAPYSFNWTNVQAGDYSITARAQDAAGQVTMSSIATVHVTIPGWSLSGNSDIAANSFMGTTDGNPLVFKTNNIERLRINAAGGIAIGTASDFHVPSDAALAVEGLVYARRLRITQSSWADFVFHKNYRLRPLAEVEKYINKYHHLPDMPSAGKVQDGGLDVGNNQLLLLQKIEELTLYVIKLNKEIKSLKIQNAALKKQTTVKRK